MSDAKNNDSKINNRVEAHYSFSPDENQSDIIIKESVKSNVVKVNIIKTDEPCADVRKFSVKNAVEIDGINPYIIIVINCGNTNLYSLKLRDRIDDNTIYISNSASIKDHSNIENYPNTMLLEYASADEAAYDTYFNDFIREKQAIDVRYGTLSVIESIRGIANIPIPAGYTSWNEVVNAIDVKFGTESTTDWLDIQKINDGYKLYENGEYGSISKAVRATNDVVNNITQENVIATCRYPLTNMVLRSVLSWLNENTLDRDNRTAIADSIRVIQYVLNKLVDESDNIEFPENKKSGILYEITRLKSILETSFMIYIVDPLGASITNTNDLYYTEGTKTKVKEVYVQDSDVPGGAVNYLKVANVPNDTSGIELNTLIEKVSSLYDLINGFLPEAINLEVDKIWFNVKEAMKMLFVFTNSLSQTPKYKQENGVTDYNNQIESRIATLSDAVRDIVAVVYNVLPFLFDGANNKYYDQYYEYVNDLKRMKGILANALLSLADSTDTKAIDNICSAFFYGTIELKRIREDLAHEYPVLFNEIETSEVIPFKFRPCSSPDDLMDPTLPMNPSDPAGTGKNPDSPEYDWTNPAAPKKQTLKALVENANNIIRELTSYIIAYEDSKKPDYIKQNNSTYRDLIFNINMLLLENEVVTLTMVTKVLGDEEVIVEGAGTDVGTRYNSINYDRNISVMNSNTIKNRIVYGYTASSSGSMDILEKSKDLPDNFNGADVIEANTDLKFAHLVVSKDIFVKETAENNPNYGKYVRKNTIECNNDICYLITLKNYGNLDARDVVVRDLLKTGMDFTGYVPEYSTEETGLVRQGDMYAYSIKKYTPGVNNYVTGINNNEGENYFHGYACTTEKLTQMARDVGYAHGENYAILTRNKSIEFRNISVPARTENSILVTETDYKDYDVLKERAIQNNNDKVIGVVEIRLYYTINCRDIGTDTL